MVDLGAASSIAEPRASEHTDEMSRSAAGPNQIPTGLGPSLWVQVLQRTTSQPIRHRRVD